MIEIRMLFLSWFTTQLVMTACLEGLAEIKKAISREICSKGKPAPFSVVVMHAGGLHVAQIGRRHGRGRRWARKVIEQDELYCFGRPAWIGLKSLGRLRKGNG